MVGIRWNAWNRMPILRPRNEASASSSSSPRAWPSMRTLPALGRSMPPITASRVDLPEPDGPTTLTELPAATSRSTPRRILTGPAALDSVTWTSRNSIMAGRSAGERCMARQMGRWLGLLKVALALAVVQGASLAGADDACRIAVLGDSLASAYGLAIEEGFPAKLQERLRAAGYDCVVLDAGVSGDTTAGGLARLDWMLADRPSHVIVELGGNDGLRALPPEQMEANLDAIVGRLRAEGVAVLLAGMRAPPNLGRSYGEAFEAVFARVRSEEHTS